MKIRAIAPLAVGTFAIGTDNFIAAGILGSMSTDLGVSLTAAGLQVTVFALVYALGSPVLAAFTQRFERRQLLVWSMALFAVANVLGAIAPGFGFLLGTRVFAAVTAGVFGPIATAAAADQVEPAYQGRAISIVTGGLTVSMVLGVPLGVLIGDLSDWRGAFWFVAAMAAVAAAAIAVCVPRIAGTPGPSVAERFRPALNPAVGITLIQSTVVIGSTFIVFTYLGALAERVGGGPQAKGLFSITTLMLAYGVAAVIGNMLGGRLADRVGGTATIRRTVVVLALALTAISVVAESLRGSAGFLVLMAVVIVWGVSGWAFTPAQFSRLAQIGPEHMHLTFALNNSAIYLGSALGASIGGMVLQGIGVSALGWVAGVGEVLGLGLIWLSVARPAFGVPAAPPSRLSAERHTVQPVGEA